MKKLLAILLATLIIFSLTACGGDDSKDDGKIDPQDVADKALDEAEELDSFSIEAVEYYLKAYGIKLSDVEPDYNWILPSEYSAYADDPSSGYGHAAVKYRYADGELSDEQMEEHFRKIFNATAAASDTGYNIIGFEFASDDEDAMKEVSYEDAMDSWIPGWGFVVDGKNMVVYISDTYDNNQDSSFDRIFYYNGTGYDIGVGLQKSFDETWDEMEDYFEENEDEIKDALEDYLN